jgi:hypothetical protein
VGAAWTVTVLVALLVASATLVAVTVQLVAEPGAVHEFVLSPETVCSVPQLSLQVTDLLAVPVTCAVSVTMPFM